jgi:TolB-like protein/Flp pilus assembly protein TadD
MEANMSALLAEKLIGTKLEITFPPYRLDLLNDRLLRGRRKIALRPKTLAVLRYLLERPRQLVRKEELLEAIWPDTFATDDLLKGCIKEIRRALDDDPANPRFIETAHRRGYYFKASVMGPAIRPSSAEGEVKAIDSLAVLPFRSARAESEYLADGLAESITYSLSRLPHLKLMSRSAVRRYKGREVDPRAVGRELGVRAIVTGRVIQHHDELLVSAELVDTLDNRLLWGQEYDSRLQDALAVQKEIAREISEKLRLQLSGEEVGRLSHHQTENTEAYRLYLQGRYHVEKMTREGLRKGVAYYEQAIARDPNYALAHVGLIGAWILGSDWVFPPHEVMPKTRAMALRLLEMDSALAEAHAALAYVLAFYDWNWAGAEKAYQRAIALNPHQVPIEYARYLAAMERFGEALAEIKRAERLDPVSPRLKTWVGRVLFAGRRYEEAIEQYTASCELDPHHVCANVFLGESLTFQARYEEAITSLERARAVDASADNLGYLGYAYARAGEKDKAMTVRGELRELASRGYVSPYYVALIHVGLGETDEAFEWLEKALEEHASMLVELKSEPKLDNIRSDPRFARLLKRVGLAS